MVIYVAEFTSKFFLLAAFVYYLIRIFRNGNRKDEVLQAAGYITGFEVFSRMTGGAFTYEFAKFTLEFGRFLISEWNAGKTITDPYHIYGVDMIKIQSFLK